MNRAPHSVIGRAALRRATLAVSAAAMSGCALFAQPNPHVHEPASLAPAGSLAYVVCQNGVTPVELATATPEATIALGVGSGVAIGNDAMAVTPDGHSGFVDTATGAGAGSPNVVVPIDLVTQQAETPIPIPGNGGAHAIAMAPSGTTVYAASGGMVVPVTVSSHRVGSPVSVPGASTVDALVFDPTGQTLYALSDNTVTPITVATGTVGSSIATGLTVSSQYSPHGMALSATGSTLFVIGQGGPTFGGRMLAIPLPTGPAAPAASFDQYGSTSSPAAIAVTPNGKAAAVVDAAANWLLPIALGGGSAPSIQALPPVRMPTVDTSKQGLSLQRPTDVAISSDGQTGWIVAGSDALVPYAIPTATYGTPIQVCQGASSVVLAPVPK